MSLSFTYHVVNIKLTLCLLIILPLPPFTYHVVNIKPANIEV